MSHWIFGKPLKQIHVVGYSGYMVGPHKWIIIQIKQKKKRGGGGKEKNQSLQFFKSDRDGWV